MIEYIHKRHNVSVLIYAIAADPAYPEEVRLRARYDYEQWFGDDRVTLRVKPVGNYDDGHPLPVAVDPEQALAGEALLFPEAGTNVCTSHPAECDEALFDDCETVVSGRLVSQRLAACPLEPRSCAAVVGADGRLSLWLSTQTPHQDRDGLARSLGLDPAGVRVVAPDVGGGFGAKLLAVEEILVSWLAGGGVR